MSASPSVAISAIPLADTDASTGAEGMERASVAAFSPAGVTALVASDPVVASPVVASSTFPFTSVVASGTAEPPLT